VVSLYRHSLVSAGFIACRFAEMKSNALTTEPRLLPDAVDKISIYATEVMHLPLFVCLSVSLANSKLWTSYDEIFCRGGMCD